MIKGRLKAVLQREIAPVLMIKGRVKVALQREIAPVLVGVPALAGRRAPDARASCGDVTEAEKEGKLAFCFSFH